MVRISVGGAAFEPKVICHAKPFPGSLESNSWETEFKRSSLIWAIL